MTIPTAPPGVRPGPGLDDPVTLDESVTMAFLASLELMTPAERVTLILHDVSGYSFPEVAEITGRTPAACRQLESSARRRVRASRAPAAPSARRAGLVRAFGQAWEASDVDALIDLLDPCATAVADDGGLAGAVLSPIEGDEQVANYLAGLAGPAPGLTIHETTVNGQPGLVARQDGVTVTALALDVAGDRVTRVWTVTRHRPPAAPLSGTPLIAAGRTPGSERGHSGSTPAPAGGSLDA